MLSISQPVCVAPTADRVAEGAFWQSEHWAVYWTDINRFLAHLFLPAMNLFGISMTQRQP